MRQYSVARTLQQNRVDERRNITLIKAAMTMLADSKLPTIFWAEAVNTAYCLVTIFNTKDHLGKFDGKADEGFFVNKTTIVEENLDIRFSENTSNIAGSRPNCLFDIDALTKSINYKPVVVGNQSNSNACTKACDDAEMPALEDISTFNFSSDHEDDDEMADINNLDTTIQMDVKSAFLYEKIEDEVYVCQPPGFEDPDFPGLQVKQKQDGIFISQDKYVAEILKKYGFLEVKNASTPMETQKPLLKDEDGE
nr:hypothetical protein [Tanacetum cinerariifolium]